MPKPLETPPAANRINAIDAASTLALTIATQDDRNKEGRVATGAHCDPASNCIETSTRGTSTRYRFKSPMTRHARSLGAVICGGTLAGIFGGYFSRKGCRFNAIRRRAP